MSDRPERTRVYQNHHLDSTRWDRWKPRPDDVVISTSYKAGTTWMQTIVASLIFGAEVPGRITEISPWLGMRTRPLDEIIGRIEAQTHRRFLKSHLALDGLPYHDAVRYIVVGRDMRDVFMSLWNHYRNYTDSVLALLNDVPARVGEPFPVCPDDPRTLWRDWITRGWFEWEHDGWPYWSHTHHAQSWWAWRRRPNILLVHFQDLLDDLDGEMRRVADHLGIPVDRERWPGMVETCTFDSMKARGDQIVADAGMSWKGGADTFLHKGTNGRWREVLSAEDLALYPEAVAKTLSPDCARWLESGRHAQSPD